MSAIYSTPAWTNNRAGDAATLAAQLNAPAAITSITLLAYFQAAVGHGADPAEIGKLWPAQSLVDRAERTLAQGDLAGISAIVATLPGLGIDPSTVAAFQAVIAARTISAGAKYWNEEDGPLPEFTAAWVAETLTAAGYTWTGTEWARS